MLRTKMEVKVISTESIKPSSPTPDHLKTLKLSLLDQLFPVPFAPIILFFSNDIPRTSLLKKSLSETLTRFYPLAGMIKDHLSIDCNDQGAHFVETRVNCHLDHFLARPQLLLLHKFLPCDLVMESSVGTHVASVQVNVFECGGIAIGLCISHKIADGAGLSTFIKAWAETTRRLSSLHETATIVNESEAAINIINPEFIAASLFPAKDLWLRDTSLIMWGSMFNLGRSATRRFVFDASAIATLKARAKTSSLENPTRVEVVTALLWKAGMEASRQKHGWRRASQAGHTVNLRRRASPPLPEHSLGNLIWIAAARHDGEAEGTMKGLAGELRQGMSRIDGDFVKRLRGEKGRWVMAEGLKEVEAEEDHYGFSSWCSFGFYEGGDFGWGRPVWVSSSVASSGPVTLNLVILVDTRSGDGIEAWVTLDEQYMAIMETDQDLISLASMDPSPLQHY